MSKSSRRTQAGTHAREKRVPGQALCAAQSLMLPLLSYTNVSQTSHALKPNSEYSYLLVRSSVRLEKRALDLLVFELAPVTSG